MNNQLDDAVCYACGEGFDAADWIVPLPTFRASEWTGEHPLHSDARRDTVVHLRCLIDRE
jgi:hypothetical protein